MRKVRPRARRNDLQNHSERENHRNVYEMCIINTGMDK